MQRINKQKVFNFYNRKNKWLGIIDYKTLTYIVIYVVILYKVIFIFSFSYTLKLYILLVFILPVIIFVLLNIEEESIIEKLKIIIRFTSSRKIYTKNNNLKFKKEIYEKNVKK